METITNVVNTVSSTVVSTVWGLCDQQKDEKEQKNTSEYSVHPTLTKEEIASLDRYPSVMGTATPPADAYYNKPDSTISGLASLSLNEGSSNSGLKTSHDQSGYPFTDASKEETITGSSTGNSATLFTLTDAGGGTDRDLGGADPRKEDDRKRSHKRSDSGVHGIEGDGEPTHIKHGIEVNDDGISRSTNEENRDTCIEGRPHESAGTTTNDGGAVPPAPGLSSRAGEPAEPSVGAGPSSGAQSTQKQQGADRPNEAPEEEPESQGTGEEYVPSTGTAAEGGDFDASKPGAGREADRLRGEAAEHHDSFDGKEELQSREGHGHKLGQRLKHFAPGHHGNEQLREHDAAGGETGKKSLGEKIKEKLHIKKDQ